MQGEVFTFGRKLHLMSCRGEEVAFVRQKVFSFPPRYTVFQNGRPVADVLRCFGLMRRSYEIQGPGWTAEGDFFAHEFMITNGVFEIARVYREWFTWGDAYVIDVDPTVDEVLALALVLVIDANNDDIDNSR